MHSSNPLPPPPPPPPSFLLLSPPPFALYPSTHTHVDHHCMHPAQSETPKKHTHTESKKLPACSDRATARLPRGKSSALSSSKSSTSARNSSSSRARMLAILLERAVGFHAYLVIEKRCCEIQCEVRKTASGVVSRPAVQLPFSALMGTRHDM